MALSKYQIDIKSCPGEKLEQLDRLHSEDTPHRLMITHTIESYQIPSQNENIGQVKGHYMRHTL